MRRPDAAEALAEHVPEGLHALARAIYNFLSTLLQPRGLAPYAMVGGVTVTLLWQGVVRMRLHCGSARAC